MHSRYAVVLGMILALLAGCASIPTGDIKVDAQADQKVNFAGYKTYAWLGSATILNDPRGQWEPPEFDADAEIKFLIDRELRKRGMSESYTSPDVIVAYAAGVDMDALDLKTDPTTNNTVLDNVPQGALVVALVDGDTGFVIWVGAATGEVQTRPDANVAKARLDYAVTQLMGRLPK